MFRALIRPAIRSVSILTANQSNFKSAEIIRKFSHLTIQQPAIVKIQCPAIAYKPSLLSHPLIPQLALQQKRNYVKFSMRKGKRKTVDAIRKRFKRLDWGIWIRTIAGKNKRIWKKSQKQAYRARQHVFTNCSQSFMLDKMVCTYWKRSKHYIDDIYAPYHSRESFMKTRKKPIEWD